MSKCFILRCELFGNISRVQFIIIRHHHDLLAIQCLNFKPWFKHSIRYTWKQSAPFPQCPLSLGYNHIHDIKPVQSDVTYTHSYKTLLFRFLYIKQCSDWMVIKFAWQKALFTEGEREWCERCSFHFNFILVNFDLWIHKSLPVENKWVGL